MAWNLDYLRASHVARSETHDAFAAGRMMTTGAPIQQNILVDVDVAPALTVSMQQLARLAEAFDRAGISLEQGERAIVALGTKLRRAEQAAEPEPAPRRAMRLEGEKA